MPVIGVDHEVCEGYPAGHKSDGGERAPRPVTRAIDAGSRCADSYRAEVQGAVEAALARERHRLVRRTDHLTTLASVTTATGVLGTLCGLIRSLSGLCCLGSCEYLLLAGLSEALVCAVFGLAAGMLCLVAHSLLRGRTQALLDDLIAAGAEAVVLLANRAGPPRR